MSWVGCLIPIRISASGKNVDKISGYFHLTVALDESRRNAKRDIP